MNLYFATTFFYNRDIFKNVKKNLFSFSVSLLISKVSKDGADYAELLFPQRQPWNCNNVNILPHPHNNSQVKPQDDMPPALPHRPTALGASAIPSPNLTKTPAVTKSQPSTLYPSLEDHLSNYSMSEIPAEVKEFVLNEVHCWRWRYTIG